jgi:hypothetical protein
MGYAFCFGLPHQFRTNFRTNQTLVTQIFIMISTGAIGANPHQLTSAPA